MRICPVCHARAFDDAEICYGCMHRFGVKDAAVSLVPGGAHKEEAARSLPKEAQMCVQAPIPGRSVAPWPDADVYKRQGLQREDVVRAAFPRRSGVVAGPARLGGLPARNHRA